MKENTNKSEVRDGESQSKYKNYEKSQWKSKLKNTKSEIKDPLIGLVADWTLQKEVQ